jgi:glutamyl-tRNA synthetase
VEADEAFWLTVRPNLVFLSDAKDWWRVAQGPVEVRADEDDRDFLAVAESLLPQGPYTPETWKSWTQRLKEETGRKGRSLFMPLRRALTGEDHGPDMASLFPLIGEERARRRLKRAAMSDDHLGSPA